MLAEYLHIKFLCAPEGPWKCSFCRIRAWKCIWKQSGSTSRTSYHSCTCQHFRMPTVITPTLVAFDCMWSAHAVKRLLDWILKLTWSYLSYPLFGQTRI